MIDYEVLVSALTNWRSGQGLPTGADSFIDFGTGSVDLELPVEDPMQVAVLDASPAIFVAPQANSIPDASSESTEPVAVQIDTGEVLAIEDDEEFEMIYAVANDSAATPEPPEKDVAEILDFSANEELSYEDQGDATAFCDIEEMNQAAAASVEFKNENENEYGEELQVSHSEEYSEEEAHDDEEIPQQDNETDFGDLQAHSDQEIPQQDNETDFGDLQAHSDQEIPQQDNETDFGDLQAHSDQETSSSVPATEETEVLESEGGDLASTDGGFSVEDFSADFSSDEIPTRFGEGPSEDDEGTVLGIGIDSIPPAGES